MHLIYPTGILSAHNGINVYRGCTHGCIYCDSRSECYQFDHPFEDVAVKANAPELLDQALRRKRSPVVVSTGAMCDPYIPLEAELRLTRRCLEVVLRHGCGATVQTKSDLVLRDLELLRQIHERAPASVQMTLTTADDALCRRVEPNVCPTSRRLEVLRACRDAGLPTVVWISPLLPFINDTEENLRALLTACRDAGVMGFRMYGYGLTLRAGSREYYYSASGGCTSCPAPTTSGWPKFWRASATPTACCTATGIWMRRCTPFTAATPCRPACSMRPDDLSPDEPNTDFCAQSAWVTRSFFYTILTGIPLALEFTPDAILPIVRRKQRSAMGPSASNSRRFP